MAGNVWEFCSDWFDAGTYRTAPAENPAGPPTGMNRVLRGGSWGLYPITQLRVSTRGSAPPTARFNNYGIRCAAR